LVVVGMVRQSLELLEQAVAIHHLVQLPLLVAVAALVTILRLLQVVLVVVGQTLVVQPRPVRLVIRLLHHLLKDLLVVMALTQAIT
jgi:hypothetical protein